MDQTLINSNKYNGLYIAIKDFGDNTVITSGKKPQEIYEEALKRGYKEPVILYVPKSGMVQIYTKIHLYNFNTTKP